MKKFLFLFLLLVSTAAFSAEDLLHFRSPQEADRYRSWISQVRCLVCQGENIADSNSMLATDLKNKIFTLITTDHNDDDIKNYLVSRYGETILYKPAFKGSTFVLWVFPFLMLTLLVTYIVSLSYKWSSAGSKDNIA